MLHADIHFHTNHAISIDVQNFPSNSTPVYITNVNCRGVERKLLECRHGTLINITDADCKELSRVGVLVNCTKCMHQNSMLQEKV